MSARKARNYPTGKGEGRLAERAAAYGRDTQAGDISPRPIRFKSSVLKSIGKPIRIVKLTKEEISAKVSALYERAAEKPYHIEILARRSVTPRRSCR